MPSLEYKSMPASALDAWFKDRDQPAFRRRQLDEWLYKQWAISTEPMLNLPRELRRRIDDEFRLFSVHPLTTQTSRDQTTKFLLQLHDGETVESVLIPAQRRDTVCVSTQVGCPVGCVFCATGRQGFIRNLSSAEIVDQVIFACRHLGRRVTNVVVMGMGEPLLNLDALLTALHRITDEDGLDLGARRVTVSTSGIPDGIRALASENRQWNLALSLHAPDEATRAKLIPARHRFPLEDILAACREYQAASGRKITFEYALINGINDAPEQARGVARLARSVGAKVNLIPCNAVVQRLDSPATNRIGQFLKILDDAGVAATLREPRGTDIDAACGQLRQRANNALDLPR